MPVEVRQKLCLSVAARMETLDRRGLSDVKIIAGSVGADARAIGGAALPLIKAFARDRELVFKDAPGESKRAPPTRRNGAVAAP
jgi:hypothetical protein